ncbi:MAG TPA: hypothetical protein VF816_17830 [Rhodocyclaceae bacterium]
MVALRSLVCACLALAASSAPAQSVPHAAGSVSFCLLQVPSSEPGRQRWVNLGIVQYVETAQNELHIVYGGGNFGAGYDLRLVYASPEEAAAQVDRMRQTAAECAAR